MSIDMNANRIGYKGFNVTDDGKLFCRDMFFEVGKVATIKGPLSICTNGIHFCWNLSDVHDYYNLSSSVICEVKPIGDIVADTDGSKCCTNKLEILRILTKEEVLKITNTGSDNTGFINSGNWNSGNYNSGHRNSGHRNSGNWNSGHCNSGDYNIGNWNSGHWNSGDYNIGDYNSGDCNSGDYNIGDYNSGDWNSGHRNSGNWNSGDWNSGFFNQEEHRCYIFDKLSKMTPSEFRDSKYYRAMYTTPFILTEWVWYTDDEKSNDKAKELIEGYLKTYSWEEAWNTWWSKVSEENKEIIKSIPGFTKKKFKEITGIENV